MIALVLASFSPERESVFAIVNLWKADGYAFHVIGRRSDYLKNTTWFGVIHGVGNKQHR